MLRPLFFLALAALLIAPEASAQPRQQVRPTVKLIGDLTVKALRTHAADHFEMADVRRAVTASNYARVRQVRQRIRQSNLTLDDALRQLVADGAMTRVDAQLFRRLAQQDDADGAKRIGTLMVESPNAIVAATGAAVLQMVNEPEESLSSTQAQSGGTGAQIGAGLDNIDWGDVAGDAAKGALVGGLIGGSVGAAIGAAVGGIASAVADFFNGFFGGGDGAEEGGEGGEGGDGGGSGGGDGGGAPAPAPAPAPTPTP